MNDWEKSKEQLIAELAELRQQVAREAVPPEPHELWQQKEAALVLLESERRLSILMANLPGMAYRCRNDRHWTMEFVSDGCFQLTGYPESELLENRSVAYGNLIHLDDRQAVWEQVQQALAERRRFQIEYRLKTATGDEKWIWEQGVGVFSENDKLQALEGFAADITDRKRAEEQLRLMNERLEQRVLERTAKLSEANMRLQAEIDQRQQVEDSLRKNEAKYRALVESCPDAVVVLDLEERIIFASQQAAQQHGILPEEMIGRQATDFVAASEEDKVRASMGRLVKDQVHKAAEIRLLRADETAFDAEVSSALVRDATGKPEALMAVYRDITGRKRAEEKLAMLGRFVEAATQGFGMADLEGRILYVNPFLARMYGKNSPDEVIGTHVSAYYPPDYLRRREREILPALRRGRHWQGEQWMAFSDGQFHPTIHSIFPVCDDDGRLLRTAAIITDITELKKSEAKLKAEQQALRRMLLASDHERRLVTYELHDGVAQQLMGALMHFQCPPSVKGRDSKSDDAYRLGMDALRQASSELRRVMNRLRTPVLDRFGLCEAIEDVAAQLRSVPGSPRIEYYHDDQLPRLESTLENSLFRIAQEAMTNACRHSRSERIRVALVQKGGEVTLEVRDWGTGFDVNSVHENRFGLEGIRERCRILGGRLNLQSQTGEGTVVQVEFPILEAAAGPG